MMKNLFNSYKYNEKIKNYSKSNLNAIKHGC